MNTTSPSSYDLYLFHQGNHHRAYEIFGAHLCEKDGIIGVRFCIWAPNAIEVRIVGDFNNWQGHGYLLHRITDCGIWALFVEGLQEGAIYKYQIKYANGEEILKSDPFGIYSEIRPDTASVVFSLTDYRWQDYQWQQNKASKNSFENPINIYEVHLGSWRRKDGKFLTYREAASELVSYAVSMGYTHLELLPLAEHPYDGSWGYQATGYFSPTSRFGTPRDFMYFVDCCHQAGLGVILDWVPGHFCRDQHGLRMFDGSSLYEYDNYLRAENDQWGTSNFDLGKGEVVSFLISNALYWLDCFHIDGLRVDAVAHLLYLNYGKAAGQWQPNQYGGIENLEAIAFLRKLNVTVFHYHPNVLMIAEDSSTWPLVTKPTYLGGLGFNYKWNMGWMNDMLRYMEMDPVHRKWHHNLLTFSLMYTFSENYLLTLSHDEVVHGKRSLLNRMPGDYWQKFANLRVLYCFMMAHPGKKLLFMGGEFGQFIEWQEDYSLDWHLLEYNMHRSLQFFVKELNHLYRRKNSLWEQDHGWQGFNWIDPHDYNQSIVTFMRIAQDPSNYLIIVCNFTPVLREVYRIGVPELVEYEEIFNSDQNHFGGSGQTNHNLKAEEKAWHNQPYSLKIKVPPLAAIFIEPRRLTGCLLKEGGNLC